jgi:hypothetical protein
MEGLGTIMATDHFNRAVDVGEVVWVAGQVVKIEYPNVITVEIPQVTGSVTAVVQGGPTGEVTNPADDNRPPE